MIRLPYIVQLYNILHNVFLRFFYGLNLHLSYLFYIISCLGLGLNLPYFFYIALQNFFLFFHFKIHIWESKEKLKLLCRPDKVSAQNERIRHAFDIPFSFCYSKRWVVHGVVKELGRRHDGRNVCKFQCSLRKFCLLMNTESWKNMGCLVGLLGELKVILL